MCVLVGPFSIVGDVVHVKLLEISKKKSVSVAVWF